MPFGPTLDWTHINLSNAFISSLLSGWITQSIINKKELKFKEEYLEQFGRAIRNAYTFKHMIVLALRDP
jgi:hypothetical protein